MSDEAPQPVAPPRPLADRRVVLGVTGSISAYKAFNLARRLEEAGATVDVALTPNATRFASTLTFRNLVHGDVVDDIWELQEVPELHVEMGHRTDAMIVAPASATSLAKIAQGIGDNMVTLTALATPAPLVVAPAMDSVMYAQPAVQANLEKLKSRGVLVAGPAAGPLASGRRGPGRLLDPLDLLGAVRMVIGRAAGDLRGRHVIVTAGGTREAIDPVRYVGNHSSGKMGFALAEAARDRGAAVSLITTQQPPAGLFGVATLRVDSAEEMQKAVGKRVAGADALVMAAAVADFKPAEAAEQKLKKDANGVEMTLTLTRTPDIVAGVNGAKLVKVGFAAETEDLIDNARAKIRAKGLELIVANDVSRDDAGFAVDTNKVVLIDAAGEQEELPLLHKYDVSQRVLDRVVAAMSVPR